MQPDFYRQLKQKVGFHGDGGVYQGMFVSL